MKILCSWASHQISCAFLFIFHIFFLSFLAEIQIFGVCLARYCDTFHKIEISMNYYNSKPVSSNYLLPTKEIFVMACPLGDIDQLHASLNLGFCGFSNSRSIQALEVAQLQKFFQFLKSINPELSFDIWCSGVLI